MFCGMDIIRLCVAFRAVCSFCTTFSVMSVQYCLCVSRIQCTQCSVSVYRVSSVLQRPMQVVFRVAFVKHSVYRVESVAYIVMVFSISWVTVYGVHGLPTIIQCR